MPEDFSERLVAKKFDGSKFRKITGRPRIDHELESLILKFAEENPSWGYDRLPGALSIIDWYNQNISWNVSRIRWI